MIKANTNDLGPLSLDSFRKNNLSASWKFVRQEIPVDKISSLTEVRATFNLIYILCSLYVFHVVFVPNDIILLM